MSALVPIILALFSGILSGYVLKHQATFLRYADKAAQYAIYGLLFVLGGTLGANEALFFQLPQLGMTAFLLMALSCIGSIGCTMLIAPLFPLDTKSLTRESAKTAASFAALWGTCRIFLCFAAGALLARGGILPPWLCDTKFAEYALWILVYAVSISIGTELGVFNILRHMHIKIFLIPAATIIGTCLGCAVAALVLPATPLQDSLSVGAGFGYYSITSIIIAESGNPSLASIALLANIFRELAGLLTTPFLAKWCGPLAPVAVAGATGMDTCLPMIARYCGEQTSIIAVFNGIFFTFFAPFCVTLIIYW